MMQNILLILLLSALVIFCGYKYLRGQRRRGLPRPPHRR